MDKKELEKMLAELQAKIVSATQLIEDGEVEKAEALMGSGMTGNTSGTPDAPEQSSVRGRPDSALHEHRATEPTKVPDGSRMIEGVFDGQHMMGADGKQYLVPQNYASKSKLVEGDIMKLSITPQGAFIYKQIGPIDRKRVVGKITQDAQGFWNVTDGVHNWRVLTASVSFFKGQAGDEAVILIPATTPSKWAAVENIIGK